MRLVAVLVALSLARPVLADDPTPPISSKRRAAAIALAVFPGVLVRGTGSYLVHDKRTGKKLLYTALIGIGGAGLGGLAAGGTGGNPYAIVPFVPMLVTGTGMFVQSWFADIYRAAGGDSGTPRARTPWSAELAAIYQHDAYRDRVLSHVGLAFGEGRVEIAAATDLDVQRDYRGGDLGAIVRILGPAATGELVDDASWVGVRATTRFRDDDPDRVQVTTVEAELVGRLDLHRITPALHGSFAELSTGGGLERAAFAGGGHETGGLLLGRFAWGTYLGRRGELQMFYDHRRDSLAGGIAAGRAAGFVGSVGAIANVRIGLGLAIHGELEIGSAWVTTLGLRFLGGPR